MSNMTRPPRDLDYYLGRDLRSERNRAAALFAPHKSEPFGQMVLYGAGRLGRLLLAGLTEEGVDVVAFSDGDEKLWGGLIEGREVVPPQEAARRYGRDSTFLVAIFNSQHNYSQTFEYLCTLGCTRVISCLAAFYRFPKRFLPYWAVDLPYRLIENANRLKMVYSCLADQESREEFSRELDWRMDLNFGPSPPRSVREQYFPDDLIACECEEVYIDCGAYVGDTLSQFLAWSKGRFRRYLAFEPDPRNFSSLQSLVINLPRSLRRRIEIRCDAISSDFADMRFKEVGDISSRLDESGAVEVKAIPLDSLQGWLKPTIIKMDIEGGEFDALQGAREIIRDTMPVLAVCVYHRPDHFWTIPELISRLCPQYRLYLRRYAEVPWELVCYGVPPHRDRKASNARYDTGDASKKREGLGGHAGIHDEG